MALARNTVVCCVVLPLSGQMIQFSARARPPKRMQIERRKPVKWTLSRRSRVRRLPSCWGSRAGQQRQRQRQWQRTRRVGGGSRVLCFASLAPYLVLTLAVRLCSRRRRRRRLRAPLSARALTSELSELEAGSQTRPSDTATGRRRPTIGATDAATKGSRGTVILRANQPNCCARQLGATQSESGRERAREREKRLGALRGLPRAAHGERDRGDSSRASSRIQRGRDSTQLVRVCANCNSLHARHAHWKAVGFSSSRLSARCAL